MLTNKIGYSYNDVTIVPSSISNVSSRSECNPFIKDDFLPIFTAPMASVINEENLETFLSNGIIPIIPRNINIDIRKKLMNEQHWVALSLKEFDDLFISNCKDRVDDFRTHYFVCIDIANGHMKSLYDKCIESKINALKYGYKLTIMTGNIANADTYRWVCLNAKYINNEGYYESAVDYIRVGIGGGSGCITTSNVSIHYPQASLINECKLVKNEYEKQYVKKFPQIIADGGIRNYDHVIKALALGADYVMIGSVFAQCIESAGEKTIDITNKGKFTFPLNRYNNLSIDHNSNVRGYYTDEFIDDNIKPWKWKLDDVNDAILKGQYTKDNSEYKRVVLEYKNKLKELKEQKFIGKFNVKFFGMASADGQKSISGEKTKTAEGITKWLPVKYTLSGWVENMISYLRSAMSYTDCKTLKEFIGKPDLIVNSISEIQAVNR